MSSPQFFFKHKSQHQIAFFRGALARLSHQLDRLANDSRPMTRAQHPNIVAWRALSLDIRWRRADLLLEFVVDPETLDQALAVRGGVFSAELWMRFIRDLTAVGRGVWGVWEI